LALVALCAFCIAKHREYLRRALMIFALFGLAICVVSIWNGAMIKRIATAWSDLLSIISGSDNAGGAGSGRWGLWVITADRISDRPWLGWGAEGICDGLLEPGNTERSHCEPLMYAAYFGIPAMVCYLAGVFATFVGAWRRRRTIDPTSVACACAAFSYFVSSCFGNMYFYTTPFFFILLGMALCRLESKGDATDILIGDRT
jgi:O-antigen ligase